MKTVRAVYPNAGVRAWYRKRLFKELDEMQRSIAYWLEAAWKRRESEIVGDASPARELMYIFSSNMRRWLGRWNRLAEWLAERFIGKVDSTTTTSMKDAFKAAGFSVKFPASRALNSVTQALIAENVSLIKSIASQYLTDVEGIVTRGVSMGRDVGYIADELGKRYAITKRRAKMIARDQTDKATMAIQRVHDEKLGITEGVWVHLPGQKSSRETHKAMDGMKFKISDGIFDSAVGRKVLPSELPCCRCVYRAVLPEFGD